MFDDGFTRPYHIGAAGVFKGSKGTSYEGGHRVPFIIYWKGHTLSNTILTKPFSIDGESVAGLLTNKNYGKEHKPIYYHNYTLEGVRDGDWKLRLTKKDKEEIFELFNLSWDPSERTNLFDDPKFFEKRDRLMELFRAFPAP